MISLDANIRNTKTKGELSVLRNNGGVPALVIRFDTSFAEIEVLGTTFLSCLAYPKYGMTAVIFFADDLFKASMQSKSSIRLSLAGDEID